MSPSSRFSVVCSHSVSWVLFRQASNLLRTPFTSSEALSYIEVAARPFSNHFPQDVVRWLVLALATIVCQPCHPPCLVYMYTVTFRKSTTLQFHLP